MVQADENSKARIMEAAVKLFAKNGFDGASVRDICREAKVNLCMISYYFGGKKELYQSTINDLIEKQCQYASKFIDFSKNPHTLPKNEQILLLYCILDKFIDFFYSSRISKDFIVLLLKEQQSPSFKITSPSFNYLRETLSAVFNMPVNCREMVFKTLFILSQINSARVLPAFSLMALNQENFIKEDIDIIKNNIKFYIDALLKEAKIV